MASNLRSIQESGIEAFLDEQGNRRSLLEGMRDEYNDGRSKSFFCVATTLLPIETLKASMEDAKRRAIEDSIEEEDKKSKAMILKSSLNEAAMEKNCRFGASKGAFEGI